MIYVKLRLSVGKLNGNGDFFEKDQYDLESDEKINSILTNLIDDDNINHAMVYIISNMYTALIMQFKKHYINDPFGFNVQVNDVLEGGRRFWGLV